jgi:putative membrane protein
MKLPLLILASLSLATAHASSPKLTDSDQKILGKLFQGDTSEVETGKFVQKHATAPATQAFASRMVEDHSTLSRKIKDWATKSSVSLPAGPNNSKDEGRKLLEDLGKLAGRSFDVHYIEAMLEDHQKDVAEVQKYMAENPDSALKPLLKETLPILQNHLRVAENVAGGLGVPAKNGLNQPEHP